MYFTEVLQSFIIINFVHCVKKIRKMQAFDMKRFEPSLL